MTDLEVVALEEGALNGWPALAAEDHGGWLWRFAAGYSKRANSVLPLYNPFPADAAQRLESVEGGYRLAGLPPLFKVPDHPRWTELDALLADRGYAKIDPSRVMTRPLGADFPPRPTEAVCRIDGAFSAGWFDGYWRAAGVPPAHRDVAAALASQVALPLVGSVTHAGKSVAWGYVARAGTQAWLFDLVVAPEFRRRGAARTLVQGLFAAAAAAGSRQGCLQVLSANAGAAALYEGLGFHQAYSYWYRRRDHA